MEKKKISFKDLDVWLKTVVVFGFISLVIYIIAFIVEFIYAFLTY